jgi:hypothetical protein
VWDAKASNVIVVVLFIGKEAFGAHDDLRATIPASDLAAAGSANVTTFTGGALSNALTFTVNPSAPPASVITNALTFTITPP